MRQPEQVGHGEAENSSLPGWIATQTRFSSRKSQSPLHLGRETWIFGFSVPRNPQIRPLLVIWVLQVLILIYERFAVPHFTAQFTRSSPRAPFSRPRCTGCLLSLHAVTLPSDVLHVTVEQKATVRASRVHASAAWSLAHDSAPTARRQGRRGLIGTGAQQTY